MNASARGRGGQNRSKNMGNRGESNFRPNNRNYVQSNVKLPRLQDIPRGTCVKCLSTQHVTQDCNIYPHAAICNMVCVVNNRPHGFHYHRDCSVKQGLDRPNRDRRSNSDFYQNKEPQSRVFRPFRAQR